MQRQQQKRKEIELLYYQESSPQIPPPPCTESIARHLSSNERNQLFALTFVGLELRRFLPLPMQRHRMTAAAAAVSSRRMR